MCLCPCCVPWLTLLLSLGNGSWSIHARPILLFLMSIECSFVWINHGTLQDSSPGQDPPCGLPAQSTGPMWGKLPSPPQTLCTVTDPGATMPFHMSARLVQAPPSWGLLSKGLWPGPFPGTSAELPLSEERAYRQFSPLWVSAQDFFIISTPTAPPAPLPRQLHWWTSPRLVLFLRGKWHPILVLPLTLSQ